jgi:hypothetical protein
MKKTFRVFGSLNFILVISLLFLMTIAACFLFTGCRDSKDSDDFVHAKVIHVAGTQYDYMVIASRDTFLHCSICFNPVWFEWPSMKPAENVNELSAALNRANAKHDLDNHMDTITPTLFKP